MVRGIRVLGALALTAATAGCAYLEAQPPETLGYDYVEAQAYRTYAAAYSETPFEHGAMSVIATERGRLQGFTLTPCRGGGAVCAGGLNGPAGTLTVTPDYWIVRGIYGGRTFYLSPGGDGAIYYGANRATALAWNSIANPNAP